MQGIIVVNKRSGWTSHDVVAKLRGILRERRIGHAGTLDPMAEGVLPVMIGRATRASEFCSGWDKEYIATMRLGVTTDTLDMTGTVLSESPADVSQDDFESACREFTGDIAQIPPMYSAIQIGGQRLYDLARRGETVEREARNITIHSIGSERISGCEYKIKVSCSKGTYIRSLVDDIGRRLGCGAAMSALVRTRTGPFAIEKAYTIDEIAENWQDIMLPTDAIFSGYGKINVSGRQESLIRCGSDVRCGEKCGNYCVYGENGEFLGAAECDGEKLHIVKSFFEVNNG